MPDNKFGTQRILNNIEVLKKNLPALLANQAQNFFVDSFKKSAWDDGGLKPWAKRQNENSKRNRGRKLLVKSGALRRAVGQSIRSTTFDKVQLVVALPYAAVHNDGYNGIRRAHGRAVFTKSRTSEFIGLRRAKDGKMKMKRKYTNVYIRTGENQVKAHNFKMPQRRFMGDSASLRVLQRKLIVKNIDKVWRA